METCLNGARFGVPSAAMVEMNAIGRGINAEVNSL